MLVSDAQSETTIDGNSRINAGNDIGIASHVKTDVKSLAKATSTMIPGAVTTAISVVNSDTAASVGGTSQLSAGHDIAITATNKTDVETVADGLLTTGSGLGMAVAVGVAHIDTTASLEENATITSAENLQVAAKSRNNVNTAARSVFSNDNQEATDRVVEDLEYLPDAVKSSIASSLTRTTTSSKTGGTQLAAGFSYTGFDSDTAAYIDSVSAAGPVVDVSGRVDVNAASLNNVSNLAQGLNSDTTANSLSAAISIMTADSRNHAYIGREDLATPVEIDAASVAVAATSQDFAPEDTDGYTDGDPVDDINDFTTFAYHGEGSKNVGIAGSLALNISRSESNAYIGRNADLDLTGDLAISALNHTQNDTIATGSPEEKNEAALALQTENTFNKAAKKPISTTSPSTTKIGVGGAFAIGVHTGVTRAYIDQDAGIDTGAIDIGAEAEHISRVSAAAGVNPTAGASSGTKTNTKNPVDPTDSATTTQSKPFGASINGALAVGVGLTSTEAYIAEGNTPVTADGSVTVKADQTGEMITTSRGDAVGADLAAGVSVAVTVFDNYAIASIERRMDTTGAANADIDVIALNNSLSSAQAKATAGGTNPAGPAQKTDADGNPMVDDQGNPVYEEETSIIDEAWGVAEGNQTQEQAPAKAKTGKGAKPKKAALPYTVSVGAAVAVNAGASEAQALIGKSDTDTSPGPLDIKSGGAVRTQALSNVDASAAANGSSVGSAIGIGVGVAVNAVNQETLSAIKENTAVDAQGDVTAEAGMLDVAYEDKDDDGNPVTKIDSEHTFSAIAISGAGAKTLGIAGSVGVNIVENTHQAYLASDTVSGAGEVGAKSDNVSEHKTYAGASVTMQVGKAGAKTTQKAKGDTSNALAQTDDQKQAEEDRTAAEQAGDSGTGTDSGTGGTGTATNYHVGLGAGVAVGVGANVSRAYVAEGTTITDSGSVDVSAVGRHVSTIEAKAGVSAAKSAAAKKKKAGQTVDETADKNNDAGIAIDGAVAVGVSTNITEAYVGAHEQMTDGGDPVASLNSAGTVNISAVHEGETITTARAEAIGSDVAAGLSVAVTAANDYSLAYLERDTISDGDITVAATSNTLSSAQAKAAAGGSAPAAPAQKTDADGNPVVDDQGNPVYEEQSSIIDESWNMAESNQTTTQAPAKAKKGKGTAKKGALPYTVNFGAAVGVNVANSDTQSYIGKPETDAPDQKIEINSGGAVKTKSLSNMDASAAANGSSVGSAIGIGIGVGVNTAVNNTFSAIKADTLIDARGDVTAEAGMLDVTYEDEDTDGNPVTKTDSEHTFSAIAISGAGAKTLGIAGSVGVNIVENTHEAYLASDTVTGTGEVGAETANVSEQKTHAGAKVTMSVSKAGAKRT